MCEEKITFNQLFADFFEWNEGQEDASAKALGLKNELLEQIKKIDEFIKKEEK
jgi:hypothetical protein